MKRLQLLGKAVGPLGMLLAVPTTMHLCKAPRVVGGPLAAVNITTLHTLDIRQIAADYACDGMLLCTSILAGLAFIQMIEGVARIAEPLMAFITVFCAYPPIAIST